MGGLKKAAAAGFAVVGAAALKFGGDSIKAFVEAEQSQAKLQAAFDKFPQLAGANIKSLQSLNSELAKKTKYDDDATASGQAVLAGFGLTADQIKKATPLLQDYATRTGKDLPAAAKDFGKAINGQGKAFKNVGLDLKNTGSAAGNFDQLMGGLKDKVGGFAAKEGKTTSGRLEIMKNQFGELEESVGSKLVPALTMMVTKLVGVGDWLSKHKPVLIGITAVIGVGLVAAFTAWATAAASAAIATVTATAPIIAIGAAIAALVAGIIWAYNNWQGFHDVVNKVASFLKDTLWPAIQTGVSWLADHLAPVIAAIASFFTDKFVPALQAVAGFIVQQVIPRIADFVGAVAGIAAKVVEVVGTVTTKFGEIVGFITGLPGRIKDAATGMWDGILDAFKAVLNGVIGVWNHFRFPTAKFGIPKVHVPGTNIDIGGGEVKFGGWQLPQIPTLHDGGVFQARGGMEGLALLRNGEGVFTPEQMAALGGGGFYIERIEVRTDRDERIARNIGQELKSIAWATR